MVNNNDDHDARPCKVRAFLSENVTPNLPDLKGHLIFWSVVILGIAADLWSKWAVFKWIGFPDGQPVEIIDGFLRFVAIENRGAAFGIASGQKIILIGVSSVALIALIVMFLSSGKRRRFMHFLLGLFLAGVCGNLYDRIFNDGAVRDFIDVMYWPGKHWPAFNIADSLLCISVGLLILSHFFTGKSDQEHDQKQK